MFERFALHFGSLFFVLGFLFVSHFSSANETTISPSSFRWECSTSEAEFYDWVEENIWCESRHLFGRNLDAAYDALVSSHDNCKITWHIEISQDQCVETPKEALRRKAIYSTIRDACLQIIGY